MSIARHSQWGCIPAITCCQSPKLVTPEKKKYPVPANKLKVQAISRKKRVSAEALRAARSASQQTTPAIRLTMVPPAATSRESKVLDQATVESVPEVAPVSNATAPWPRPSCSIVESISAITLMATMVGRSSFGTVTASATRFSLCDPSSATLGADASEECHAKEKRANQSHALGR